jgi:hypothetical protein
MISCSGPFAAEPDGTSNAAADQKAPLIPQGTWNGFNATATIEGFSPIAGKIGDEVDDENFQAVFNELRKEQTKYRIACEEAGGRMIQVGRAVTPRKLNGEKRFDALALVHTNRVRCEPVANDVTAGIHLKDFTPAADGWLHFDGPSDILLRVYQEDGKQRRLLYGDDKVDPWAPIQFAARKGPTYRTTFDLGPLSGKAAGTGAAKVELVLQIKEAHREPGQLYRNVSDQYKLEIRGNVVHIVPKKSGPVVLKPIPPDQGPRLENPFSFQWNGFDAPIMFGIERLVVEMAGAQFSDQERKTYVTKRIQEQLPTSYRAACEASGGQFVPEAPHFYDRGPLFVSMIAKCVPGPDALAGLTVKDEQLGAAVFIDGPAKYSVQVYQLTPRARQARYPGFSVNPYTPLHMTPRPAEQKHNFLAPLGGALAVAVAAPPEGTPAEILVVVRDAAGKNVSSRSQVARFGHVLHVDVTAP